MPKVKISEYSATANSNTDVASINIDEGCAPSGINNAIRAIMGHLKDFQQGTNGDPFNGPVNGTVGATTPSTGAFTTLSATGNVTLGDASTDTLNVGNGGLIKDASGNVGVGFTPSANAGVSTLSIANYNKTFSALTFGSNANSAGYVGYNMGNTSTSNTWKYISADTGSALYFAGNEMRFMQFASGSAGATTNGTQAMTLDASGNLGIGTTSPSDTIGYGRALDIQSTTGAAIYLRDSDNPTTQYAAIAFDGNASVNNLNIINSSSTGPIRLFTNGAERARIDSSGNLLVGTTTPTSAERLSIWRDNVTTNSLVANIQNQAATSTSRNSNTLLRISSNASGADAAIQLTDNTANNYWFGGNNGGAYVVANSNGVRLANGGTSWASDSDERIKDIIEPILDAANKVLTLRAVIGKYKTDKDGTRRSFLIAQDVQAVLPEAVFDEQGTLMLAYTDTIPLLVAAIKEQQVLITQLTARITALESA